MASATTAAAVKAAVNPVEVSVLALVAPAEMPIAVKVAVPSAAPTWVADPARPDARPAWASGTAEAMTMVVGMKLSATPTATSSRPGENRDQVAGLRRCVSQPQVTGGQDHQADHHGAPRTEGAQHAEAGARARRRTR